MHASNKARWWLAWDPVTLKVTRPLDHVIKRGVIWQIKKIISPLSQDLKPLNLTGWWLQGVGLERKHLVQKQILVLFILQFFNVINIQWFYYLYFIDENKILDFKTALPFSGQMVWKYQIFFMVKKRKVRLLLFLKNFLQRHQLRRYGRFSPQFP